MKINQELLSNQSTHIINGIKVKAFRGTQNGNFCTAEIMEGEHKGKWTTINLNESIELDK